MAASGPACVGSSTVRRSGLRRPAGRLELRAALSEYLARARGVRASPERILICSGFAQASWLLCQALRAGGARTLAPEQYGLPTVRATAAACGLTVRALPVDEDGARLEFAGDAERSCSPPRTSSRSGCRSRPAGGPRRSSGRWPANAWSSRTTTTASSATTATRWDRSRPTRPIRSCTRAGQQDARARGTAGLAGRPAGLGRAADAGQDPGRSSHRGDRSAHAG